MTHDRWIEVKNNILEQFAVNDQGKEEYADQPGFFEFIDFMGPMGEMRLEWSHTPRIVDRRGHTARRGGAHVREEVVYSDQDFVEALHLFKIGGDGGWEEVHNSLFS
ncbi:MAG: hypothetical protein A3F54_05120 [Candidatus Kerfeldbacteria bacterium RIFCSPHIGHO2_12_FULL_48_17]|uniref:Uncharacterized protein n=1 Tax=Candidatus Kerfeldbacteria bacterium RIFCSPHIGHO2_12_FULL_48_17 TaxID=1798542 RepID=A0A1G2B3G8_9BACT|nr:MAG: hypothetical protein A3F54_05120 [Candidatus Kerfeldbacteria bacterium RIFCSPHIGHO2_12_FULL_48_17]